MPTGEMQSTWQKMSYSKSDTCTEWLAFPFESPSLLDNGLSGRDIIRWWEKEFFATARMEESEK